MRGISETRLECIRLASMLATAKAIGPNDVIPRAMEYYRWIQGSDDEHAAPEKLAELRNRFR